MISPLEDLESRSYKTYRARLQASKRLQQREYAWNAFLISLSVSTTIAAVALLVAPKIYGPHGDVLMVCLAVLALAASLIVPSLNYSRRARDMFSNYRRIQRLSAEVERGRKQGLEEDSEQAREFFERYQSLLDESENHVAADYVKAVQPASSPLSKPQGVEPSPAQKPSTSTAGISESVLTLIPYLALVIPVLLLAQVVRWIFGG